MKKNLRRIRGLIGSLLPASRKKIKYHPQLSEDLVERIRDIFDPEWYGIQYPHVIQAKHDPFKHFVRHGLGEGLSPNAHFMGDWYLDAYKDVSAAEIPPLVHYLKHGEAEGRAPHPDFDINWYSAQHPEAEGCALQFHMKVGRHRNWPTRSPFNIEDYLPSTHSVHALPAGLNVDVILPVYKGLAETQRCLEAVLADTCRPSGRLIVIDDCSPEPELSHWLDGLASEGAIDLLRNEVNLGFVRSVNRGMQEAGRHDVVLLNSDTEVPEGWLKRLAGHAHSATRIGTVTPLSNNATICSYPSPEGGPLPEGRNLQELDGIFARANAGRSVTIPTGVGFCMYIKRACLDEVGLFDAETFGLGYGEENDFCMRSAKAGWEHRLACDTYVFHEGEVSFGRKSSLRVKAQDLLHALHPTYARLVINHIWSDPAAPSRLAATSLLLREGGLPVILLVTHALGGGTERHVQDLVRALKGRAQCLILRPNEWGYDLSFPGIEGHSNFRIAADRIQHLSAYLHACGVQRVHIHHQMGYNGALRNLICELGLPFDVTVHDYYNICPQINLITPITGSYCGEPDIAFCNACIARSPVHGAKDIITWRLQYRWMIEEAERVLCPSRDVLQRLQRFGLHGNMIVAPHQPVTNGRWPHVPHPVLSEQPLRIAILGTLAGHKGAAAVRNTVISALGMPMEFILIGSSQPELELPEGVAYSETGAYEEGNLISLIKRYEPHLIWFPALWPETYSYTLTAAIESGLPIIASNLGAFPERLAQHPQAILVPPSESAALWISAFNQIRDVMLAGVKPALSAPRPLVEDYYQDAYLAPLKAALPAPKAVRDLRSRGRVRVLLVPEMMDNGAYSPCAYIRTILPLDRLAEDGLIDLTIATPRNALHYQADILLCQRHITRTAENSRKLIAHAADTGMRIFYDIDDNLLGIPKEHPEYAVLKEKAERIEDVLRVAERVVVSTLALKDALSTRNDNIHVIRNSLDERLFQGQDTIMAVSPDAGPQPVRILYMGTATHDADMDLILPALERLHKTSTLNLQIEIIGVTGRSHLPAFMTRFPVPQPANQSYPAFMSWLASQKRWDIGISPLADSDFNRAKSSIKALDYMAIGAVPVVSDVTAYRDLPSEAVVRVSNDTEAWFCTLERLVKAHAERRIRTKIGQSTLLNDYVIGSNMDKWADVLRS